MTRGSTATGILAEGCPYLRAVDAMGDVAREPTAGAAGGPTPAICAAGRDRFAPGPRQRALLCTTARHAACPRFPAADRRATDHAVVATAAAMPWDVEGPSADAPRPTDATQTTPAARPGRGVPLPTVVAGVLLLLALVSAFAFTAMRGGIDLAAAPGGAASPEPTAPVASAVPSPTVSPRPTVALPSPVPTTFPSPTVAATQPATPLPTPRATPTPSPADPRYAGLRACPDRPGCYLYVVRRGDTLSSIAASFGVPLRAVRDLNEDLANPSIIRVGQKIRVPGPG